MPKIHVTTDDGELVEQMSVDEQYDLSSPIHRSVIKDWVVEAVRRARLIEQDSKE